LNKIGLGITQKQKYVFEGILIQFHPTPFQLNSRAVVLSSNECNQFAARVTKVMVYAVATQFRSPCS